MASKIKKTKYTNCYELGSEIEAKEIPNKNNKQKSAKCKDLKSKNLLKETAPEINKDECNIDKMIEHLKHFIRISKQLKQRIFTNDECRIVMELKKKLSYSKTKGFY